MINPHISYTLNPWLRNLKIDFTLNNCLCGSVKLTKNGDPDRYKYSGYGIGFDYRSKFSFTDGSLEKNIIIFGAGKSSCRHIDNKKKKMSQLLAKIQHKNCMIVHEQEKLNILLILHNQ